MLSPASGGVRALPPNPDGAAITRWGLTPSAANGLGGGGAGASTRARLFPFRKVAPANLGASSRALAPSPASNRAPWNPAPSEHPPGRPARRKNFAGVVRVAEKIETVFRQTPGALIGSAFESSPGSDVRKISASGTSTAALVAVRQWGDEAVRLPMQTRQRHFHATRRQLLEDRRHRQRDRGGIGRSLARSSGFRSSGRWLTIAARERCATSTVGIATLGSIGCCGAASHPDWLGLGLAEKFFERS